MRARTPPDAADNKHHQSHESYNEYVDGVSNKVKNAGRFADFEDDKQSECNNRNDYDNL